jgi:2,3-bisphosphoglycerate-independent phosphoglycerate mutase
MSSKALLLILDGWGIGKHDDSDAIYRAQTPLMDKLMATSPVSNLKTFGPNVGLPEGQMGNSEVGHMNIGAGRVVYQMLMRINKAFEERTAQQIDGMQSFIRASQDTQGKIHLFGLMSDGGVHASLDHLLSLCEILKDAGLDDKVRIHCFTDGRDTDPKSGIHYLYRLLQSSSLGKAKIATIIGRYFAMDRDKRWERIKKAYDAMVHGTGSLAQDPELALKQAYDSGTTDEFVEPIVLCDEGGNPLGLIEDHDVALSFNFRTDRGRELTMALTQEAFHEYNMHPLDLSYFTMTEYDKTYKNVEIIFDNSDLQMTMGEYLASLGLKQLRAAETEKYPHVTFFFSGGRESAFDGEDRVMIPSPKVATYDMQPEMSAPELCEAIDQRLKTEAYDFLCVNFANPDMVGHTGVFSAIKKACETVDHCVEVLTNTALSHKYKVMIIADHGNADFAVNEDGSPNTAHSKNLVPCIVLGEGNIRLVDGILADVAPTILNMMGLDTPPEMTGKNLIEVL